MISIWIVCGSSASGIGYTYEFFSSGSPTIIGPNHVLGSNAPKLSVVDIGSDGGCAEDLLVTTTASTLDNSNIIFLGPDATVTIHEFFVVSTKVYAVDHTSLDGNTLVLSESFQGSTTGAASCEEESPNLMYRESAMDLMNLSLHWRTFGKCPSNSN